MKHLILALTLVVGACTGTPPASPSSVAETTRLDEHAALGVELAYQAAATALLTANRAGIVPASAKPKLRAADQRAYAAVQAVRAAYRAGNSGNYATALIEARAAVSSFLTSIKGPQA